MSDTAVLSPPATLQKRHIVGYVDETTDELGSNGGFVLAPTAAVSLPPSPVVDDINTVWDTARFLVPRRPVSVGHLGDRTGFSTPLGLTVDSMPLKFPGTDYRVPRELESMAEALQLAINCEHSINPAVGDYYAYLTLDQDWIKQGETQRGLGLHSDGVQGTSVQPKREIEHGYTCTDRDPTRFYCHPFDLSGYDVDRDWFNGVFEAQSDHDQTVQLPPYDVVLFDAYSVHGAVPAAADGSRTFFRFFYSPVRFTRFGNTHNALFDYQWPMSPRPVPKHLRGLPVERGGSGDELDPPRIDSALAPS